MTIPILSIRDENGNVIPVPAIQGVPGKDGANGNDGKTPVKGVDYWTAADKSEIINALSGGTATAIPSYWQEHLDIRVDNIRAAMEKAGRNKSAFLFYSDAHWDNGSKNVPMLLNYLTANTAINKTIFGGDIVGTEPTADTINDRSIMKYLWDWRTQIRNLKHYSVVGNHDDGNATNNIFSYDYVYSFLFAPEENNSIVRGADTYYYFDENREQTRYLCLDTGYEGLSNLSTAQTAFIKDALISTPENWHIVVVSHIWYMPDYNQYDVRPIPLTGLSTAATQLCEILNSYNARSGEFENGKAKIEFCIGGHVHRDYVGSTAENGGIPIILVDCAGMGYRGEFTASIGTISETTVSGIVADYDNDKLSVIRVGRGNSFEVILSTGGSSDIPEEDRPTTPTYTNVLDEVGYKEGYRLSGNSGEEKTSANHDVSGYIPCASGNYIYLKNVNMPDDTADYSCFVGHYAEDKTFIDGYNYNSSTDGAGTSYDSNGYCVKFKVHTRSKPVGFIRICCLNIDDTSIITVNEPIE